MSPGAMRFWWLSRMRKRSFSASEKTDKSDLTTTTTQCHARVCTPRPCSTIAKNTSDQSLSTVTTYEQPTPPQPTITDYAKQEIARNDSKKVSHLNRCEEQKMSFEDTVRHIHRIEKSLSPLAKHIVDYNRMYENFVMLTYAENTPRTYRQKLRIKAYLDKLYETIVDLGQKE